MKIINFLLLLVFCVAVYGFLSACSKSILKDHHGLYLDASDISSKELSKARMDYLAGRPLEVEATFVIVMPCVIELYDHKDIARRRIKYYVETAYADNHYKVSLPDEKTAQLIFKDGIIFQEGGERLELRGAMVHIRP